MSVVCRPYLESDREAFGYVRSMTYRGAEPVLPDEKLLREDCLATVLEVDGRIVGACTILDMMSTRGPGNLRTAGVAAVAVVPEARGGGIGNTLMERILGHYRGEGFLLASLYPFRASYYRKFGYAYAGTRLEVTCPEHRFPRIEAPLRIRHVQPSEFGVLRDCYESFARRYSGMNLRSEQMWWRQTGGDTPYTHYVAGDPPETYVSIRLVQGFWEKQEVHEVVWSTPAGYLSALALMGQVGINQAEMCWYEPSDGPFMTDYYDYPTLVKVDRPIMYRVLDVPGALRALRPDSSGEFRISVVDDLVPENQGPWAVHFKPDGVDVSPTSEADFELNIRPFTQALLGDPSFDAVLRRGHVKVSSEAGVSAARRLLVPSPVYCMDFF